MTDDDVRFPFGKNWEDYLRLLDDERIDAAVRSLQQMLATRSLEGQRFLDVGSGSGLFSLAARRMGATVHSFDYDEDSVRCTAALRDLFHPDDADWVVERGDVLDRAYVGSLGTFDVVYSWGVLHHTGNMDEAVRNAASAVAPGGTFFIAIYNRQRFWTPYWKVVKRVYCRSPRPVRGVLLGAYATAKFTRGLAKDLLTLRDPRERYRRRKRERGMSVYYDWVDWLGGYPFEAATAKQVIEDVEAQGFSYRNGTLHRRGHGCNEFVFQSVAAP